jgi:Fe-S cluster biosynthesis and repair protein YggX
MSQDMSIRTVQCVVLKQEAEALDAPPYPGELGQRIFENVSKEGWRQWLERLTTIINENGLNTSDPQALDLIEKHMKGFFFAEGDYGHLPAGFHPVGAAK